jgi:hypothetical protein
MSHNRISKNTPSSQPLLPQHTDSKTHHTVTERVCVHFHVTKQIYRLLGCSIAMILFVQSFKSTGQVRPNRLRRIVGFAYNGENVTRQLEFTDIIIVAESYFTQRGRPKNLSWSDPTHHIQRFVHVVENNNHYTKDNKWGQESQVRRIIGTGVRQLFEQGLVTENDLVAIVDADESLDERAWTLMQQREIEQPGRVWKVALKWALYNECWIHKRSTIVASMSTVGTLRRMEWDAQRVRAHTNAHALSTTPVGLHCSWCFGPVGSKQARDAFRRKISSMTDGDATDYNHYEQQLWSDARIDHLMRHGLWLDNVPHGKRVC